MLNTILAVDNHNSSPNSTAGQLRNYRELAREVTRALRHANIKPAALRICFQVLEFSFLAKGGGRDAAPIARQDDFCDLDGKLNKARVSGAIKWLVAHKVIERGDGVYSFLLPPAQWLVKPRATEGRQSRQLELELRFEKLAAQLDFRLEELNAQLKEDFLSSVAFQATAVAQSASPSVAQQATAVARQATRSRTYIHDQRHDRNSMTHAKEGGTGMWAPLLAREFQVAAGRVTGREIIEEVKKAAPGISDEWIEDWIRRLSENANLVWKIAKDAQERGRSIRNPAGWLNTTYMNEQGV